MARLTNAARRIIGILLACAAAMLMSVQTGTASARAQSSTSGSPPVAMIVLDMSKALTGAETEAARKAAQGYADALPPDVRVGLVTFSYQWRIALSPTTSREALDAALQASQRTGETAASIYGALAAAESAVKAAGGAAGSRLLLLSEGETIPDPALTLTLPFPVDVITWYQDADDNTDALDALASTSGGRVAALAGAAALANEFPGYRATAHAAPNRPAGSPVLHRSWSWKLLGVLACVFGALLLVTLLLTGALNREDRGRRLEAQLARHYAPRHGSRAADAADDDGKTDGNGRVASTAISWVARLLSSTSEQRLAGRLDLAGIARGPAEWVLLGCCASLPLAVLLTVLTETPLIGVPAGALLGWLGMRLIVSTRITRRRAAFAEQLPDVLQLVAGALQSGFSLPQAIDAVVREDTQPSAGEFSRALAETRIGGELEAALDRVADRMDSTDLRWTVMAIRIQREVGGNLVEVLRNTVDTMRERAQMRRQVRALSAEGRLSAYILIALPVLMAAYMFLARPEYIRPLYTTPLGLVMLIGGAVLVVLGSLWMRQVVKVEV